MLRDIADVTCLPGKDYDEERYLIERAVAEKGPFDAFGVSHLTAVCPVFYVDRGIVRLTED